MRAIVIINQKKLLEFIRSYFQVSLFSSFKDIFYLLTKIKRRNEKGLYLSFPRLRTIPDIQQENCPSLLLE